MLSSAQQTDAVEGTKAEDVVKIVRENAAKEKPPAHRRTPHVLGRWQGIRRARERQPFQE